MLSRENNEIKLGGIDGAYQYFDYYGYNGWRI